LKITKGPANLMYPCPVTLVTSRDAKGKDNIVTIAWIGVLCSEPPKIGIGIHKTRHSTGIIEKSGEFVVNIPSENLLEKTDYCGTVSGKDVDKFSKTGLTKEPAKKVKASLIKECPVNLECVVREKLDLGSHRLFVGEVVEAHVDDSILDGKGNFDFSKAAPVLFNAGEYWGQGKKKGSYGFAAGKF
jgi:flavin reductase (DIM6/NTAB) family NADH-FMN oxidoreductase RutF